MKVTGYSAQCGKHRAADGNNVDVITCEYTVPNVHDKSKAINYATVIVLCSIGSTDSPQADKIIRAYRSRGYRLNVVHCSKKLFAECLSDLFKGGGCNDNA